MNNIKGKKFEEYDVVPWKWRFNLQTLWNRILRDACIRSGIKINQSASKPWDGKVINKW